MSKQSDFMATADPADYTVNSTVMTRNAQNIIVGWPSDRAEDQHTVANETDLCKAFEVANSMVEKIRRGDTRYLDQILFSTLVFPTRTREFGVSLSLWEPSDFYPYKYDEDMFDFRAETPPDQLTGQYIRVMAHSKQGRELDIAWTNDGTIWVAAYRKAEWMQELATVVDPRDYRPKPIS